MSSIEELAAMGVEFLDQKAPGWRRAINVETLLSKEPFLPGFNSLFGRYELLTEEWQRVIRERKTNGVL